ncbi:hypothetical protein HAP94_15345, partial [Acidithiobacillus ferrivorans]|nr:hypothetical protein [Acidithiobacillus ferrivorans]
MSWFKSKSKKSRTAVKTPPVPLPGATLPGATLSLAQPRFNDLEAEFIGTYHAGKALRMAYTRELFLGAFAVFFAVLYFAFPRTVMVNHYFATEPNGTNMPMVAYNKPFDTDTAVISWTEQTVTGIFSFDALDYRRRMASAQRDFTSAGFVTFLRQFKKNGLYDDMMTRKLMISAVQSGTAVMRLHGLNPQGVYAWQVQIPVH